MKVNGGCHCGDVTYEAEIDPARIAICHCTDCQTISGSAFRTVAFTQAGTFKLTTGQPKTYIKTAASGAKRAQVFCPECGSHLYAGPGDGNTDNVGLRVGTLRQRDAIRPTIQVWCDSAQAWLANLGDVPQIAQQS
ncbi:MAG: GFA family protein [Pseudomonadota bacterium]